MNEVKFSDNVFTKINQFYSMQLKPQNDTVSQGRLDY